MTHTTIITPNNEYRFNSYGNPEMFFGNFAIEDQAERTLYNLDEFDKQYTADVPLKTFEKIFRCSTACSRITGIVYLVKINTAKNLVYFNTSSDEIIFETRGTKMFWFNHK